MLVRRNGWLTPVDTFDMFDRQFDRAFEGITNFGGFGTDVTDEGNAYKLVADLPGFKKEDIHINVENDMLTVSAERHSEVEDESKKGKFVRRERSYGSYQRSFSLGDIDVSGIQANYNDGVLTVELPKKQIPESTKTEITIN